MPEVVGIIYPPPEVRNIVDKTAAFVSRNGVDFEQRIRQNEINNPKFNFLTPSDPYHAYYQHKVKEFLEGKAQEPVAPTKPTSQLAAKTGAPHLGQQERLQQEIIVPKEPPPQYEFIIDPPSISAADLDIVRLTAQFVARNGRPFLTSLMQKEAKNYQFDFLRPQHSLFQYFTRMVEQYTKVLLPHRDLLQKLDAELDSPKDILRQVRYRVEWTKMVAKEKQREEEERERERVSYLQIDWHDFVIVETVDFQPGDVGNFPPPTTPDQVGARILLAERRARGELVPDDSVMRRAIPEGAIAFGLMGQTFGVEDDELLIEKMQREMAEEAEEVTMEEAAEETTAPELPPPSYAASVAEMPPPPPPEAPPEKQAEKQSEGLIIRKDYNPKAKAAAPHLPATAVGFELVSPLTGERLEPGKVASNIKYNLLDPKWIQDKDKQIKERMERESVYAVGANITENLRHIAERRTDIFGVEETEIGKTAGDAEQPASKDSRLIWDGHAGSKASVSAAARLTADEQVAPKPLDEDKIGPKIITAAPMTAGHPATISAPPVSASQVAATAIPLPIISAPRPHAQAANMILMQQPMLQQPPIMLAPQAPGPMTLTFVQQPTSVLLQSSAAGPAIIRPPTLGAPTLPTMQIMQAAQAALEDDELPNKKARTEESLVPEADWLASHEPIVTFAVQCPRQSDKPDWDLRGQMLKLSLPLTDTISVVKAKIQEQTGVPPAKQKLQLDGLFTKDALSLAFYNIAPGSLLVLQMKERGGRKK